MKVSRVINTIEKDKVQDEIEKLKNLFQQKIIVSAIKVPSHEISLIMKTDEIKKSLLHIHGLKKVVVEVSNSKEFKLLLLEDQRNQQQKSPNYFDIFLQNSQEKKSYEVIPYEVSLTIDNFTYEEILRAYLPENHHDYIPTSFETVGHIAHLNLRDELAPYRYVIGSLLLLKKSSNGQIKTVVSKEGIIESEFRQFKMTLLAGKDDYFVDLMEHGFRYQFNYKEVYWNSKLQSEHQRLSKKYFNSEDVVIDMFAGVGPFVMPTVGNGRCKFYYANDLNPKSFEYLNKNIKLNRLDILQKVKTYNLDARDFVRSLLRHEKMPRTDMAITKNDVGNKEDFIEFSQVIMNLPKTAHEFLDVFIHLFPTSFKSKVLCHCYVFDKDEKLALKKIKDQFSLANNRNIPSSQTDRVIDVDSRIANDLIQNDNMMPAKKETKFNVNEEGRHQSKECEVLEDNDDHIRLPIISSTENHEDATIQFDLNVLECYHVRDVSTSKRMFCVSFELPKEICWKKRKTF